VNAIVLGEKSNSRFGHLVDDTQLSFRRLQSGNVSI
jgi:hypothetical protein